MIFHAVHSILTMTSIEKNKSENASLVSLFYLLNFIQFGLGGPKRPSAYNLYLRDHKEIMRKVIWSHKFGT